ncbi:MAG: T9SS type A sorting domain-containing protein [Bacteroidetes bacterium]|nr:T9SS type A sorting domain-containing protein [Bacteroidota bacterium]HRF16083.1 MopE-related protein [Bacteroidia bacterium]
MLSPFSGWPAYNFRFTPGAPSTIPAGTYNVGVGQTYNSLTQAVADINHRGINGSVTLNLTDALYDTTAANGSNIFPIFVATPNADSINTLTITKIGTPATLAYRGSSITSTPVMAFGTAISYAALNHDMVPILGVCGSYTTVSNINLITHGSPQVVDYGLLQFDMAEGKGAQHNLYDKITVDLDRTYGNAHGMYSVITGGGWNNTNNSYNTWRDITIKDCNYGFRMFGAFYSLEVGNQLITSSCNTFNYIGDPNTPDDIISSLNNYGVWVSHEAAFTMRNTIVQNVTTTSTIAIQGVLIDNVKTGGIYQINNNIIRNIKRINSQIIVDNPVDGMCVRWGNNLTGYYIYNNSISNILTTYAGVPTSLVAARGFAFDADGAGMATVDLYNNSVSIDGSTFPNASNLCLQVSNDETYTIKNNVFANFTTGQTGAATHTSFFTGYTNNYGTATSISDYNNYYVADTANGAPFKATTTMYSTQAAWQAAMTINPNSDVNSQFADPHFVNNANNLHATSASTSLDGTATTPPAYITTDIDCQTRTAPHDIGFDDFSLAVNVYYADTDGDTFGDLNNSITSPSPTPPPGYVTNSTDCDDNNAAVNPGATEVCNGIDDNCNGQIDEGVTTTFYADTDGDGFGDAAVTTQACTAPVGYVSNNTDCDDNNNTIYPGATEVCGNGIDDDCDGQVDEGCGSNTWYADADADTYGDLNNFVVDNNPTPPAGYVADSTDCDDNNAAVNPGATEICGNAIDDNCNGQVDENSPSAAIAGADTAVCSVNSTTLGATAPLVGSGSWSIVSGVGGSIAQPNNPNSTFSGQYNKPYVLEWTTSNGGCVFSDQVTVIFVNTNYSPGRIAGFSGQTSAVCGLTQTYAAIPNHPYATYSWSGYPAGTTVNLQSGNQITLTYPSSGFNYFQLKVTSTVCGVQTPIRSVAMKGAPSVKVANGPAIVCANATGIVYNVDLLAGVTYNWSVPQGATIVNGQGTNEITVDWGNSGGLVLCNIWNSCGSSTAKKSVTTNCRSAQQTLTESNSTLISIFPNPSSGVFNLHADNQLENVQITVTDLQGRTLINTLFTGNETTVDLSNYTQGVYMLQLHSNKEVQTYKLIKD